jgi:peptidoglycan/xylan/chitin deacetylase (PgdA/CDA1 family)
VKFLLTLDYELFFGARTGTPEHCMIRPTDRIVRLLEEHDCLLTLFVDVAYLDKLRQSREPVHRTQLLSIAEQLRSLASRGHDIGLHIHSHWEDSSWTGKEWRVSTDRFRLHDFSGAEQVAMVERYSALLHELSGQRPVAYRAGGWCLQPFANIAGALRAAGVDVDSTVYRDGRSTNPRREFDFRGAPAKDTWVFDDDPLVEDPSGWFVEVPISTFRLHPLHYWKTFVKRVSGDPAERKTGDGVALENSTGYYLRKLLWPEHAVVSVDGSRAEYLESAWRARVESGASLFNVMGHPKSLTDESLFRLQRFLQSNRSSLEPVAVSAFSRTTR